MAKNNKNANYVTDKTQVAQRQAAKVKSSQKTKEVTKQVLIITAIVLAIAAIATGFVFWMVGLSKVDEEREFFVPVGNTFEVTDTVEIDFEGYGTVKIELYGKEAPKTVENFKHLVEEGKIKSSLITISTSTTNKYITIADEHDHSDEHHHHEYIKGEFFANGHSNKISHVAGVLTMNAGSTAYNSSSTDFKILLGDYTKAEDGYNGKSAAFGKVTDGGLKIIEKMAEDYREKASTSTKDDKAENELIFGDNSFTITEADIDKDTVNYTFTPLASGKYTFKSTSKFASILVVKAGADEGSKSGELGTEITTIKDGVEYDLVKGEEYSVTLKFAEDAAKGKFLVSISGKILFAGENEVSIKDKDSKEDHVTFDFTANMTGYHTFTDKDGDLKDKIEIFDGENSLGKNSAYLEKDKKYTVIISNNEVTGTTYKINVAEPTVVVGTNTIEVPEFTIREGKAYYYFTATEDAKFLFVNKDLTIKVYDKDGNELAGGNYVELTKDETYRVEIIADLLPELTLGATNVVITADDKIKDKAEYEKEFTFTAYGTGKYTFTSENVTYSIYNGTTAVTKADDGTYSLVAGKTYKVIASTASEGTYGLEITAGELTDEKDIITTQKYTIVVQDPILSIGSNDMTITDSDVEMGEITYSITATTNGPFSFVIKYQKLNDEGEWEKDENGKNINIVTKNFKIYDKDGNELDAEYAMLEKDQTYTVVLKTGAIKADAIAAVTITKISPEIADARISQK